MKTLLRQPQQGRSGYVALMLFLLTYFAAMAIIIAPDHITTAVDRPVAPALE